MTGKKNPRCRWQRGVGFSVAKGEATPSLSSVKPNYAFRNFRRSVPASPIKPVPISIRLPGSGTAL